MSKIRNWFQAFPNSKRKKKAKQKQKDTSLFLYLFSRIEVLWLIILGVMAYTLYDVFSNYLFESAVFLPDEARRYWFSVRLVGALLVMEVLCALTTAYFRYNSEWDKSIITFIIALIIAIFNHYTILEIFTDFEKNFETGFISTQNKMLLLSWGVFAVGEIIGFVMSSKGQQLPEDAQVIQHSQQNQFQTPQKVSALGFTSQTYKSGNSDTSDTVNLPKDKIDLAIHCMREGLSIRSTSQLTKLSKYDVEQIKKEAGL